MATIAAKYLTSAQYIVLVYCWALNIRVCKAAPSVEHNLGLRYQMHPAIGAVPVVVVLPEQLKLQSWKLKNFKFLKELE